MPDQFQNVWAAWKQSIALAWIGLMALGVPLIVAPLDDVRRHGLRTAGFEAGAAALLALLLMQNWTAERRRHWAEALRTRSLQFLAVLFCWGCLSVLLAPAKDYAVQGLLLWGAGIAVAVTVAGEARARPRYELLLLALTGATFLISLIGLGLYGAYKMQLAVGLYNDHMLYGAVFTILLPLMLAVSLSPVPASRRLPAQGAMLCGLAALALSQTRSAWIGVALSLIVFLGLSLYARVARAQSGREKPRSQKVQTLVTVLLVIGALGYLVAAVAQSGGLESRLKTLTTTVPQGKEVSVAWRFSAWQGAEQMIRQKPWLGWGIGGYPRFQFDFTGTGHDAEDLEDSGPTIFDEAHNSYLQIAAEMGLPGLLLWAGVLVSAWILGVRSLRRLVPGSLRQWGLIGCLSALAGQAIDAFANPGWQFGEVSLFLWIVLGLTIALALGPPERGEAGGREALGQAMPIGLQIGKVAIAATSACGLLWVILQTMPVLPAPKL